MKCAEVTSIHTRLINVALIPEESQVFWQKYVPEKTNTQIAYEEYWFGDVNKITVRTLLTNLKARFASFFHCLYPLRKWTDMSIPERNLICHWHLQLSDPLYRKFSSEYLSERFFFPPATIYRDDVVRWVNDISGERWMRSTHIQFASKLISCAKSAGFVSGNKDPRSLHYPQVSNRCLSYLFYLLREIQFSGDLLDNPYLKSIGLQGMLLQNQLRQCPDIVVQKMGDVTEFNWSYSNLQEWADMSLQGASDG